MNMVKYVMALCTNYSMVWSEEFYIGGSSLLCQDFLHSCCTNSNTESAAHPIVLYPLIYIEFHQ